MAQALVDRISIAIDNKQAFRVMIVLPLHPEGRLQSNAVVGIMHYQASIHRHPHDRARTHAFLCSLVYRSRH